MICATLDVQVTASEAVLVAVTTAMMLEIRREHTWPPKQAQQRLPVLLFIDSLAPS